MTCDRDGSRSTIITTSPILLFFYILLIIHILLLGLDTSASVLIDLASWNEHTDLVFDVSLNRSRPHSDIQRTEIREFRTIRVLHDRHVRRRGPDVDKLVIPFE